MSTISLRLPDSLHKQVRKLAERESVSINQLITLALAEKLSALMTEEYLEERAKRGSRKKFERAMAKVPRFCQKAMIGCPGKLYPLFIWTTFPSLPRRDIVPSVLSRFDVLGLPYSDDFHKKLDR